MGVGVGVDWTRKTSGVPASSVGTGVRRMRVAKGIGVRVTVAETVGVGSIGGGVLGAGSTGARMFVPGRVSKRTSSPTVARTNNPRMLATISLQLIDRARRGRDAVRTGARTAFFRRAT